MTNTLRDQVNNCVPTATKIKIPMNKTNQENESLCSNNSKTINKEASKTLDKENFHECKLEN